MLYIAAAMFVAAPRVVTTLGTISSETLPMMLAPWVLLPVVRALEDAWWCSSMERPLLWQEEVSVGLCGGADGRGQRCRNQGRRGERGRAL